MEVGGGLIRTRAPCSCMQVVEVGIAGSATLGAKKARRGPPVFQVSVEEHAKQFMEDLFVDSGVLFCRPCEHSTDFSRVDSVKDCL